jgi:hypothetical protein
MKLYYLAGSCALAPHIALEHSRLPYEAIRVERGKQTDTSYLAINPLGRVPSLVTTSHGTITEVPAVLSFIADMAPEHSLMHAGTIRSAALDGVPFEHNTSGFRTALAGRTICQRCRLHRLSRTGCRYATRAG